MLKSAAIIAIVLTLCGTLSAMSALHSSAQTIGNPPLTDNISAIPSHPDIQLQPLDTSVSTVTAATAVAAAERMWSFSNTDLDAAPGVVRARVTLAGSPTIRSIPALLVVANIQSGRPLSRDIDSAQVGFTNEAGQRIALPRSGAV